MKYLKIESTDSLSDLAEKIGSTNIEQLLSDNNLERVPAIGKAWDKKCKKVFDEEPEVGYQRKIAILNKFTQDSDIYEQAALADENTWKVLSTLNAFPDYLYVSDIISSDLINSYNVLGNNEPISKIIYDAVQANLLDDGHKIDPANFSTFSTIRSAGMIETTGTSQTTNPLNWFSIPVGEVSLYSSIVDESIDIPAYPESVNDRRVANYQTMPDLLYQYEPWQLYTSSGPRSNTYEFHLHRDMWTGDHTDGKANELIRFFQANCYPQYNGSTVNVPWVTLYVSGSNLITGVMTDVNVNWTGPIGLDGWYLEFTLSATITEVSKEELNYSKIMNMPLIG